MDSRFTRIRDDPMRTFLTTVASLVVLLVACTQGRSAAVEADPNKQYSITPAAGPWMICAASFTGPDARQLAHQLVIKLRAQYRWPAYVYDWAEEQRRQQEAQFRAAQNASPNAPPIRVRIEEQCAVLVGGFADMETARRALNEFKKLKSEASSARPASVQDPLLNSELGQQPASGDFPQSFVVHNPALPNTPTPSNDTDSYLKELNSGESYSLLNCRKPWTLAIKEYEGATVVLTQSTTSAFLEKLGFGSKPSQALGQAGSNAHELAEALRKLHIEAYVLHTRHSSLVTIGAFDKSDGPEVQRAIYQLNSLDFKQVKLFAQPVPWRVPQVNAVP